MIQLPDEAVRTVRALESVHRVYALAVRQEAEEEAFDGPPSPIHPNDKDGLLEAVELLLGSLSAVVEKAEQQRIDSRN